MGHIVTDLSSPYDLVDHKLLIKNLELYGIKNNAIELLKDFLCNQKVFTQVQRSNNTIKESEPCFVIQGSKLSEFLRTIFSIEIPILPKIMKDAQLVQTIMEITIPQYYGVEHYVNQYMDNSTNLVGCDNRKELENYLTRYHKILETSKHQRVKKNRGR